MTEWKEHVGKPNKQVYCAFQALKANELQKKCFEHFQNYLNSLCLKKKHEEWVFNSIFPKKTSNEHALADILATINDWANRHLHRGLRPLNWQMEWAENELSKLFYTGKTIDEQRASLYASFETDDLNELQKEFEHLINLKYPEKGIQIKWSLNAEINISTKKKGDH